MKMSSNNAWANRPRAREEMVNTPAKSVPFLAVLFTFMCFISAFALGMMFVVHVLHDANAIDWTLSFRQCQIITVICTVGRAIWNFVFERE